MSLPEDLELRTQAKGARRLCKCSQAAQPSCSQIMPCGVSVGKSHAPQRKAVCVDFPSLGRSVGCTTNLDLLKKPSKMNNISLSEALPVESCRMA